MKQFVYIFLISVFTLSCTSNTIYKKPENLIPRDEMVEILVDMQLALGAKSIKNIDGNKSVEYMHLVYEKHKIDSARFAESNFYYMTNIDEFNKVLRKTKSKIQAMKKEYEDIRKKQDSVINSNKTELKDEIGGLNKKRNVVKDTMPIVR
ncbi:MAG: hypothetical protein ACI8RP_001287 [Urechidicola sp.]|jgi:hypothetical protein|tara:strand:+ start:1319 stop:1768 length:450 start_codon:yes stop_codon:yes gene_type:complete